MLKQFIEALYLNFSSFTSFILALLLHSFFFFFLHFSIQKRTSTWNPSSQKFLREKIKLSLKFKTKNWDFGREEWNNYHCKFVLLCKSKLLTDQRGKKDLIKELWYRGEEKNGEERQETDRERERSMGREESKVHDSEGMRAKERKK